MPTALVYEHAATNSSCSTPCIPSGPPRFCLKHKTEVATDGKGYNSYSFLFLTWAVGPRSRGPRGGLGESKLKLQWRKYYHPVRIRHWPVKPNFLGHDKFTLPPGAEVCENTRRQWKKISTRSAGSRIARSFETRRSGRGLTLNPAREPASGDRSAPLNSLARVWLGHQDSGSTSLRSKYSS